MKCTYPAAFMLALTVVLLAGSAVSSQPKQAGEQKLTVSDLDGNELLRLCTSELPAELTFCTGYIQGIRDGLVMGRIMDRQPPFFAIPAKATSGQLKDVVVKALKEHPETRRTNKRDSSPSSR